MNFLIFDGEMIYGALQSESQNLCHSVLQIINLCLLKPLLLLFKLNRKSMYSLSRISLLLIYLEYSLYNVFINVAINRTIDSLIPKSSF